MTNTILPTSKALPKKAAKPSAGKEDRHFVTALARGLEVLACFRSGDIQLGNQELAEACKLPKSTVSRLTMTLTRMGYLIQVPETGRYRLGMATLALGSAMLSGLDVRRVARPLMQELATFAGAAVALGARERLSMIYVEHCRAQTTLMLSTDVGSRFDVASSAIGRAYLAAVPEEDRRGILLALRTEGEDDWFKLQARVERAVHEYQELGVTCAFGDWQKDINGIARAVRPGGGLPLMAISCTGPSSRLSREFLLAEVRPRLVEMTARIEAMLPR
jgi:DNA-binding IclR family transcriptional regulator